MARLTAHDFRIEAFLLAALAALSGCSFINSFDMREDTIETCTNDKDDDGDGLKNCLDPECVELAMELHADPTAEQKLDQCLEMTEAQCSDGIDNDYNRLVDCQDEKCTETPSCQQQGKENNAIVCADAMDNDGDTLVDCLDPDCHSAAAQVCDPAGYSTPVFGDAFSYPDIINNPDWGLYDFVTLDGSERVVSTGGDKLHVMIRALGTPTVLFREETGVYSKRIYDLWDAVTDIVADVTVTDNENHTQVLIGLAIDSTMDKPFIEKPSVEGSGIMGRKAVLVLLVDGLGRMQLGVRKLDNERMRYYPDTGFQEPSVAVSPGAVVRYRISIDDSLVNIYQKVGESPQQLMLGIPNPYDPGIARLFLVASTDKAGDQGKSEMSVEGIQVYQVSAPEGPQIAYQMAESTDPQWTTASGDAGDCYYNPTDRVMEVTWTGRVGDTCYALTSSNVAERRFKMAYRFQTPLQTDGYFLPGLWDPLMNFDLGMAFAAGVFQNAEGNHFVFRSCSSNNPANNSLYWEQLGGKWIRVISGHDLDKHFSYALFQDADSSNDLTSILKYNSDCFNLTQFGFTSQNVPATLLGASISGTINEVEVTEFAPPGETRYGTSVP